MDDDDRKPKPDELEREWYRNEQTAIARFILEELPRPWWEIVRADDADLERARMLIGAVVDACQAGDRALLDRFEEAIRALYARPSTGYELMARFVDTLEHKAMMLRDHQIAPANVGVVFTFIDPAFEKISRERWIEVFRRIEPNATGAGHRGVVYYAAELAVEAGAFGFVAGDSFADRCDDARKRLTSAREKARRKKGHPSGDP